MIKTGNPCFDPATNTIDLGSTFREFLDLIGVHIGGRQLKSVKPQMERLFKCVYIISNNTEATSQGVNFTVAEKYQIDWLNPNLPSQRGKSTANWVQLSKGYVAMLADHPVPVDLKVISRLRKPMALDIYWWLTKRVYGLHEPVAITWQRLYQQFGSDTKELWKFKQRFKEALAEVLKVYDCNITCGPDRDGDEGRGKTPRQDRLIEHEGNAGGTPRGHGGPLDPVHGCRRGRFLDERRVQPERRPMPPIRPCRHGEVSDLRL